MREHEICLLFMKLCTHMGETNMYIVKKRFVLLFKDFLMILLFNEHMVRPGAKTPPRSWDVINRLRVIDK